MERRGTAEGISPSPSPPLKGGRGERGKGNPAAGLVAEWQRLRRWGPVFGWSADDFAELEAALRQAEREGDADALAGWRHDLAERIAFATELAAICRRAETRCRKRCELQRRAEEGRE